MTADVLASTTSHSASTLPNSSSSTSSSMPPLDSHDAAALVSSTDALSLTSPDAGLPKEQDNGILDTSCDVEPLNDESHDDEKKSVDKEDQGAMAPSRVVEDSESPTVPDSTALPPPPSAPPPTHVTVHQVSLHDARGCPGVYSGPLCVSTDLPDGHDGCMVYPDCQNDNIDNNHDSVVLKYTGDWIQGHWEGTGTSFAASGESFTGTFSQSMRVQGRMISADGRRVYEGHYNAKGQRDGTGTMTYYETAMEPEASQPDQQPEIAAVYAGDWKQNQRHGHGTYHDLRQGIQYEGDFERGAYHGQGVYQWKDGKEVYTGSFCRGQPHGKGVHTSRVANENGSATTVTRHAGLWSQGQPVQEQAPSTATSRAVVVERQVYTDKLNYPNSTGLRGIYRGLWNATAQHPQGHGTMEYQHDANSSTQNASVPVVVSYEGCWKKGRYHGHGRLVWSQGDAYEGPFVAGQRHTANGSSSSHTETGTYCWADGRVYTGGFQHNVRTGQGLLVYPNQDYYQGAFLSGLRHGQGRFVFADGSCYEGAWSEGHYHGKGRLTQSDGTVLEGTFANGNLHGHGVEYSPDGLPIYDGEWIDGQRLDHYQAAAAAAAQQEQDEEEQRQLQQARHETTEPSQEAVAAAASPPAASSVVDETATQPHTWVAPPLQDDDDVPRAASTTSRRSAKTAITNRDHDEDEEPCHAVVDQAILDAQNNPGKYTGLVSTRTLKPHGVGRLVYADGKRIHEGFWIQGSKEGRGRCLFYPQGDFFDGEFQGNLRNGPGKYQWKNGRLYVGNYKNDLRHGHGVFTYPTGERYEGEFRQGRRWGFGRFDFQNDEDDDEDREQGYYEGYWKAGQYHGKGKLVLASESVMFEGTFAHGSLHGHGVKRDSVTGEVLEEGIFVHGVLQEEGTAGVAVEQRPGTN